MHSNQTRRRHELAMLLLSVGPLLAVLLLEPVLACGPGRVGGRRYHNRLRKYPPLVQRQYIPNVSENTLGASGRAEGAIGRKDKRFAELVQNWNPDIEFRDDERTGADRIMSQRLKEKLSVLAISVMNQWPNVKLRVIEGWDEDYRHSVNSLHYEGRAVDITTSDKDKSKYGMLARLAVEAGFDWVHYESRSHVHCSVKSEKADSIRNNGCFDGLSLVETPMGPMEMSRLQTNDLVLAMNPQTGELHFSPVMMWLDRDETSSELFVELKTQSGQVIRLTSSHLIYTADEPPPGTTAEPQRQTIGDDLMMNRKLQVDSNDNRSRDTTSGSNNNYYYFYDYNSTSAQSAEVTSSANISTNGTMSGELVKSQLQETKLDVNLNAAADKQQVDLREYVYANYARNVVVGQYLLISAPNLQVVELAPTTVDAHASKPIRTIPRAAKRLQGFGRLRQPVDMLQQLTKTHKAKFEQIVSVNYVNREGIYAPLTREGNIVVNSVVASCYAVINDHDMAHWSFAPIRWLNRLQEWIFGLRPETPVYDRLYETIQRRSYYQELQKRQSRQSMETSTEQEGTTNIPGYSTTNGLNRTSQTTSKSRHIHWYPILLYNIARVVLPNYYLY